jgi:hypothetical protein
MSDEHPNAIRPHLLILFFFLLLPPLAFGVWLVSLVGPTAGSIRGELVAKLLVATPVVVAAVAIQLVYQRRQARRGALSDAARNAEVVSGSDARFAPDEVSRRRG